MNIQAEYATRLLAWFDRHGRHDLPWQHPRTPYRVWLSEIMLQQTQVAVVIPYFERFIDALPDLRALANASQDEVLALWSGLGYYARARNLHAAARRCVELHDADLPRDLDALIALPGIGRSTAGAILSQAWGDAAPILDGNVKRVLCRLSGIDGWPGLPKVEKQLWGIAETLLPAARLADYTQAQMDFGATLCTRAKPACILCPLQSSCAAHAQGLADSLPTPKPSKVLPEREATALLLEDSDGRILLLKRPPTGIWASLWTLPQADTDADMRDWFAREMKGTYDNAEELPVVVHTFSHYRLHLQPLRLRKVALRDAVRDNDDSVFGTGQALRWVARGDLATLGLPAPIRKLLSAVIPA